jgi:hypothetical protein
MSAFYGVDLNPEEVERIARLSSFEVMKSMSGKFDYIVWGNKGYRNGTGTTMQPGGMLHKGGQGGGGKAMFTAEENAEITRRMEVFFKDDAALYKWFREGGEY